MWRMNTFTHSHMRRKRCGVRFTVSPLRFQKLVIPYDTLWWFWTQALLCLYVQLFFFFHNLRTTVGIGFTFICECFLCRSLSIASKSRYSWNIAKYRDVNPQNNQPSDVVVAIPSTQYAAIRACTGHLLVLINKYTYINMYIIEKIISCIFILCWDITALFKLK